MAGEASAERAGFNEATFRDVNEGIERASDEAHIVFVCECARLGCNRLIERRHSEYRAVRAHPRRFLVRPGHELPDLEDVVESHGYYLVVQKRGEAGAVAAATHPRPALDG